MGRTTRHERTGQKLESVLKEGGDALDGRAAITRAEDPLAALVLAAIALRDADADVRWAVERARAGGATWATVGRLLGITGEGARKRYGARG